MMVSLLILAIIVAFSSTECSPANYSINVGSASPRYNQTLTGTASSPAPSRSTGNPPPGWSYSTAAYPAPSATRPMLSGSTTSPISSPSTPSALNTSSRTASTSLLTSASAEPFSTVPSVSTTSASTPIPTVTPTVPPPSPGFTWSTGIITAVALGCVLCGVLLCACCIGLCVCVYCKRRNKRSNNDENENESENRSVEKKKKKYKVKSKNGSNEQGKPLLGEGVHDEGTKPSASESKVQRIGIKVTDAMKNVVHKTTTHSKDLFGIKSAETLEGKKWYLGNTSNQDAESRLKEDSDRSDGSYVVYDHPDRENSFALLVWWKDKVHKLSINGLDNEGREKMEYVVGEDVNQKKHSTVKALIKYHRGVTGVAIQPEDGTRITLKKFTAAAPPQVTPHPESQTDILPGSDMPATGIKPSQDGPPQATVTVHQTSTPPLVTSHPESQTDEKPGSKMVFTVTATGTEPLSYQWQKDGVNLTDGSSIRGTTTAKLSITAVQKGDEGGYTCVVTNTAGADTSKPATLEIVTQAEVLTGKTWYPGNISHQEAVSRLMEDSDRSDGSYVVYDHPDRKNSFVLLVWWKGHVHKLSINEVRSTDDEGREKIEYVLGEDVNQKKHSTVEALIKYHRGVTGVAIQLEDGTRITLKKPIARARAVPLEEKRWYHGNISHDEAESRLRRGCGGKGGTYLVYDNPSSRKGSYMYKLPAYYQEDIIKELEINRVKLEGEKFGYVLGEGGPGAIVHSSVKELVKYHRGLTGVPIQLRDGRKFKLTEHVYLK